MNTSLAPTYGRPLAASRPGGFEAPSGVDPLQGLNTASYGRRLLAYILDTLVLAAGVLMLFALAGIAGAVTGGAPGIERGTHVMNAVLNVPFLVSAALVLYFGLLQGRRGRRNGQSIGKRAMRIRIVSATGGPIGRATAVARTLVLFGAGVALDVAELGMVLTTEVWAVVAALAVLGGLFSFADVLVAPLVGEHRRTLHDRLPGTVVVDDFGPVAEGTLPIAARPRTALTWTGFAGLWVLTVLMVLGALAAFGQAARLMDEQSTRLEEQVYDPYGLGSGAAEEGGAGAPASRQPDEDTQDAVAQAPGEKIAEAGSRPGGDAPQSAPAVADSALPDGYARQLAAARGSY